MVQRLYGPLLAALVIGLACLGCGEESDDGGGGAAPDETLTAEEVDALATCAVPFEAIVRSGASAGLEVRGLFVFDRTNAASLAGAALGLDTGGQATVTGSVTGDQIDLQITLPDGGTIAGTGTLDVSLDEGCGGSMAGPFTGPGPDDAGDWIVYPEFHETVRGTDFTTWYLLPYSLGRTQILRQTIRTVIDASGTRTRVTENPVVLGVGTLGGPLGIAALTPGGMALTREGEAYIVWVTDAESGELRGYRDFKHITHPQDGPLSEAEARLLKHGYLASVSYIDAQVGRLLDALDQLGLAENTIVVLWGDHGWKLGEQGSWCKMTNYEIDTRVPLILSAPGMKQRNLRSERLVEFVDVYPTLCELAGLPVPPGLDGLSAVPLLENPARPWKKAAFSQFLREGIWIAPDGIEYMGYTIRTDRYRYVEWINWETKAFTAAELYDHENDPLEQRNIANLPENAALVQDLAAQMKAGADGALPAEE